MDWETQIGQSGRFLYICAISPVHCKNLNTSEQEATPPAPSGNGIEDDWGDDGEDEDLWVAASQLDQAILSPAPDQVNNFEKNLAR